MTSAKSLFTASVIGALLGAGAVVIGLNQSDEHGGQANSEEKKPLYWVAPMDSSYRRDKPGKSPMGMDLVPVYEEEETGAESEAGTVVISPNVVNNLGVRTDAVRYQTLHREIATVGYVQYNEDTLIHIHPRVDGWIEKLFVKAAGNPVKQGEPLYTLYSPQLVNAQEEFLIALKRDNRALIDAAKDRLKALQLSDSVIRELEQSRKVKQTVTFYSPQDGVVDGLKIREGFYVKPGTTLFSIGKLDKVWVEAEVFERDAALVKAGLAVSMTLDYLPGKRWQGVVDYVYPTLDPATRTLGVRLTFDNPDYSLKPNMFAQVTIHAQQGEPSLIVPKEAVIRTGKQDRVVLALGDGQFKSVDVEVGRIDREGIQILAGLRENDEVVTSAQFLIDSESSKTSDFKRMSHDAEPDVDAATVDGTINFIDLDNRTLNISRGPIEKWNRPATTMDFVAEQGLDLASFSAGDTIVFTFEIRDDFVITEIAKSSKSDTPDSHTKSQSVDHSMHH